MEDCNDAWFARRTSQWQDWPAERLLTAKQQLGVTVSVVIPARNEQRTVGSVVGSVAHSLIATVPLVDELIVMDSDSTDATAEVAARAGAMVYHSRRRKPGNGPSPLEGGVRLKYRLLNKGDQDIYV